MIDPEKLKQGIRSELDKLEIKHLPELYEIVKKYTVAKARRRSTIPPKF